MDMIEFAKKNNVHMTCERYNNRYMNSFVCILHLNEKEMEVEMYTEQVPVMTEVLETVLHDVHLYESTKDEIEYKKIQDSLWAERDLAARGYEMVKEVYNNCVQFFGLELLNQFKSVQFVNQQDRE